jgi:predicted O-methyltransferase YrrM
MSQELWAKVDDYINRITIAPDAALEATSASAVAAGLPPISVTPAHGKLLHLIARAQGAKRILEVGALAGYSTIWLARALPAGGRLMNLE